MSKCIGIMGWLYGHEFESYPLYVFPKFEKVEMKTDFKGTASQWNETMKNKYGIRCKRCGAKKD